MVRGAKKGENRFGDHQAEKLDLRLELIRQVLKNVKEWKMSFPNIWQLSKYVASEVNKVLQEEHPTIYAKPRGKITAPTISTKNVVYRRELEKHLQSESLENQYSESVSKIFELELRIDELTDENKRLQKYIQFSNIDTTKLQHDKPPQTESEHRAEAIALDACHKIILSLVEASDEFFIFNDDQIEDSSRIVEPVVVNREQLSQSKLLDSYIYKGFVDE